MRLEPLGRLPAIAGRPAAAIDLAQDVLGRYRAVVDLDVLEQLLREAELTSKQVHGVVVVLALEHRFYDLLAPLQRAIGGAARSVHLETGAGGQEVGAVLATAAGPPPGWTRHAPDPQADPH